MPWSDELLVASNPGWSRAAATATVDSPEASSKARVKFKCTSHSGSFVAGFYGSKTGETSLLAAASAASAGRRRHAHPPPEAGAAELFARFLYALLTTGDGINWLRPLIPFDRVRAGRQRTGGAERARGRGEAQARRQRAAVRQRGGVGQRIALVLKKKRVPKQSFHIRTRRFLISHFNDILFFESAAPRKRLIGYRTLQFRSKIGTKLRVRIQMHSKSSYCIFFAQSNARRQVTCKNILNVFVAHLFSRINCNGLPRVRD